MHLNIVALLLMSFSVQASTYGDARVKQVTSIYDADTFRVDIDGWPEIIGNHVPIRVNGVDAPEIRGKCKAEKIAARKAKQHTVALLRAGKMIELRNMQRGKYFRILADVYIAGNSLAFSLIAKGLARPYQGGKRQSWCR
ncbi:thermonuclease family protein [Methylomarinum sp. Ch1-1]|uniref:Thermonuclease family protein n=1 Tax=Methylomarinum roseum TaxID=3067653 RepID=A0AAU7NYL7_9GAMM|nr:thermonuclease family protein [Methylomarinum sp. Ch1-1]MDP4521812.1 thermonuclease family protein [Methylomarinum sp. Ch1-1]